MVKKECVKVLVRTRPTANFSQDQILVDTEKNTVRISRRDGSKKNADEDDAMDNKRENWNFQFNKVLHNAGQEQMYTESTEHIVSSCLEGKNGTVLAYGQTGAGKTFTMMGDTENYKQRGLIPRAIAHLFSEIADRPQTAFKISASFMEIYNEKIFDLLDDNSSSGNGEKDYQITEDPKTRSMQVRGLTLEPVENEEDALNVLFRGEKNKIVAEHQLNQQSNRSHSIFTLHVEQRSRLRTEEVLQSKLNMVDLAGSERLKKAIGDKIDDKLKRESRYINKSLTYLEQVVVALTGKGRSHIPYRQTKLTNVLKDSLGGNSTTTLVACIWGEAKHIEESISTLKLAQRMMKVENLAASNVQSNPALLLKRYERQIRELKQELMMHDALAKRSGISYEEFSEEERREIARQVRSFVDAAPEDEEANSIQVQSVRQVQECFRQFKLLVLNVESEVEERLRKQFLFQTKPNHATREIPSVDDEILDDGEGQVGEDDDQEGFALGQAAPNARPKDIEPPASAQLNTCESKQQQDDPGSPLSTTMDNVAQQETTAIAGDADMPGDPAETARSIANVPVDRDQAFKLYIQRGGSTLHQQLVQTRHELQSITPELSVIRKQIKTVQAEIASSQSAIEAIRAEEKCGETKLGDNGEAIIDEEEYRLLLLVKDLKKEFRAQRENYDNLKAQKDGKVSQRDQIQVTLLNRFDEWYKEAKRYREEKNADQDVLDDGEQFEQLELERVQSQDPESVAFFKATKAQKERARRRQRPVQQSRRV